MFDESHAKIIKIQKERKDSSKAKTIEYLIYLYEEQKFRPEKGINYPKTLGQIIDADKPHTAEELRKIAMNKGQNFVQLGERK